MKSLVKCLVLLLIISCQTIIEDSPPNFIDLEENEPTNDTIENYEFKYLIYSSPEVPALINLQALLPDLNSQSLHIVHLEPGVELVPISDQYQIYQSAFLKSNIELLAVSHEERRDKVILIQIRNEEHQGCVAEKNDPVYFSTPLYYEIEQGSNLSVDLLELFCLNDHPISVGVRGLNYLDYENNYLKIYLNPQDWIYFEFTPPTDYVGTQAQIYELCYGLSNECRQNFTQCDLSSCDYFIYLPVVVKVK